MRPSSARALLACSTLVLGSLEAPAAAQEPVPASEPDTAPARGNRALLFEIKTFEGGGFQVQEFEGLLISFKRHWSERNAFRIGLDLDASITDTDRASTFADSLASQTSRLEESLDRESLALVGQYLGHTGLAGGVRAYWGAGPRIGFARSHNELTRRETDSAIVQTAENDQHSWSAGVEGAVGVEWLPARQLGFLVEYGARATYNSDHLTESLQMSTSSQRYDNELDRQFFRFEATEVRIGLSIYF